MISKAIGEDSDKDAEEARNIEIKYEARDKTVFEIYNNWIIKCMIYSVTAIDKNGKEPWNMPVLLNKPLLKFSMAGLLVAYIRGRNIYLIKDKVIKWQTVVGGDIIYADINKDGFVSVVHKTEGYKALLDGITQLPLIKQFNKLGGFVFGALEGLLTVYIIFAVIMLFNSSPSFITVYKTIEQ
ncbi:MAG TPA: DUF5711 family protein [Clostridiales bacterium]|nr:DUF5711 family protein [Clostridiales bacterium]